MNGDPKDREARAKRTENLVQRMEGAADRIEGALSHGQELLEHYLERAAIIVRALRGGDRSAPAETKAEGGLRDIDDARRRLDVSKGLLKNAKTLEQRRNIYREALGIAKEASKKWPEHEAEMRRRIAECKGIGMQATTQANPPG